MKNFFTVSMLSLLVAPAMANQVYISRAVTCADLQQVLKNDGQLTLRTRLGENTYVASTTSCTAFQQANPAYEASKDKDFCFVGYQCEDQPEGGQ